jgi:hypothetical protein
VYSSYLEFWTVVKVHNPKYTNKQTNTAAFSPQANYTDWSTATCWRSLVPTFADRAVSRGQRGRSLTAFNLSFLDRGRYFSFKLLLIYPHKGWADTVPDPLLLRKCSSAGNRTRDLWGSVTTRPQRRSKPKYFGCYTPSSEHFRSCNHPVNENLIALVSWLFGWLLRELLSE